MIIQIHIWFDFDLCCLVSHSYHIVSGENELTVTQCICELKLSIHWMKTYNY